MNSFIIILITLIMTLNLIPMVSAYSITNTIQPITNTQSVTNTIKSITNTTQLVINKIRSINNKTKSINNTTQSLNNTTLPVNMTKVKKQFDIIANTPYNEQSNNCNNKSEDFANYLVNNNASNVSLVEIGYKDGTYSHKFVEWNGLYYDPTNNPPYFGVNENEYLQALKKVGFTGNITIIPYTKF